MQLTIAKMSSKFSNLTSEIAKLIELTNLFCQNFKGDVVHVKPPPSTGIAALQTQSESPPNAKGSNRLNLLVDSFCLTYHGHRILQTKL